VLELGHEGRRLGSDDQHNHDQDDEGDAVGGAVAGAEGKQAGDDERDKGENSEDNRGSSLICVMSRSHHAPRRAARDGPGKARGSVG
jgi:hypothetical protein